jgi:hypothetical protein
MHDIDWREAIDESFGNGPEHRGPDSQLVRSGRRRQWRRRGGVAVAAAAIVAAPALGWWGTVDGDSTREASAPQPSAQLQPAAWTPVNGETASWGLADEEIVLDGATGKLHLPEGWHAAVEIHDPLGPGSYAAEVIKDDERVFITLDGEGISLVTRAAAHEQPKSLDDFIAEVPDLEVRADQGRNS